MAKPPIHCPPTLQVAGLLKVYGLAATEYVNWRVRNKVPDGVPVFCMAGGCCSGCDRLGGRVIGVAWDQQTRPPSLSQAPPYRNTPTGICHLTVRSLTPSPTLPVRPPLRLHPPCVPLPSALTLPVRPPTPHTTTPPSLCAPPSALTLSVRPLPSPSLPPQAVPWESTPRASAPACWPEAGMRILRRTAHTLSSSGRCQAMTLTT